MSDSSSSKNHQASEATISNNNNIAQLCDDQVSEIMHDNNEATKLEFSEDEEDLIARMFKLLGDRWSLIAGRIPGRTAEEIESYWNSKFSFPSDECSSSS